MSRHPKSVIRVTADNTAVICAWCADKLAGDQWAEENGKNVSHGMCNECAHKKDLYSSVGYVMPEPKIETRTEADILKILNGETPS